MLSTLDNTVLGRDKSATLPVSPTFAGFEPGFQVEAEHPGSVAPVRAAAAAVAFGGVEGQPPGSSPSVRDEGVSGQ